MNKVTPRLLSILCCFALLSATSSPAFAQARASHAASRASASFALPALAAAVAPLTSPALAGGASLIMGAPALAPAAVPALAPAAAPASALSAVARPAAAAPEAPKGPESAKTPADAQSQAGDLAGKLSAEGADAAGVSRAAFDGGDGNGGGSAPVAADGSPLHQYYPRAVFIQDVFAGPASEKTVEYVNKLVDAGVHVVFLTRRAQKGEDSAESILLSRVKQSRNNPVIVVSHNGGKVSLHGRAANPKSIIESVGAFPEAALAKLREIGGDAVVASPSESEAFSVAVPLDTAEQSPKQAIAALNRKIRSAGLDYKAEEHPTQPGAAIVYSMPLRFSIARVFQALEAQFPGENHSATPEKFLILADSVKSPKFSTSFPKQAEVQVAQSGAAVENLLGAVLGDRTLEAVSLKLGKLRQFVEYWEPSKRRVPSPDADGTGSGTGGGSSYRGGDRKTSQMFAMFVGTLMFTMMARLYDDIFRGQHQNAKLTVLQAQLRQMWYNPMKYGVYVNKQLAATMKTAAWKAMSRGYLEYANAYLTNYYLREFGDYARAAKNVQENYVGLSTDRKSLITLEFKSSATGKVYKIHTRIPRVMKLETAEGLTLTAYAYRTGKETPDDGEEFLARMLAMALLKGHARKGADGKWHHGSPEGPVIAKLRVQLEYRSSHRSLVYDTADFLKLEEGREINGPIVQEIISAIEREEADAEYQQYWKEQDQQASKEDMKKQRKPSAKAKPSAKTVKAKPAVKAKPKAKPARRSPRGGK